MQGWLAEWVPYSVAAARGLEPIWSEPEVQPVSFEESFEKAVVRFEGILSDLGLHLAAELKKEYSKGMINGYIFEDGTRFRELIDISRDYAEFGTRVYEFTTPAGDFAVAYADSETTTLVWEGQVDFANLEEEALDNLGAEFFRGRYDVSPPRACRFKQRSSFRRTMLWRSISMTIVSTRFTKRCCKNLTAYGRYGTTCSMGMKKTRSGTPLRRRIRALATAILAK
jgi:hypothetical protein